MPLPSKMNPLARRPPLPPLTFTAVQANSTVKLNAVGSLTLSGLQYRMGGEWASYTPGTAITLANIGDRVQFQNTDSTLSLSSSNYARFAMTGKIAASGSVQSLLNDSTCSAYCYFNLFRGCASLTAAPALPASVLGEHCYHYMFRDCTSLTAAPALPATSLTAYCYNAMFYGCTSLASAPALPATSLATYCCGSMFSGCTSLTDLSGLALPATTLADYCYNAMFQDCTALAAAPALPASVLGEHCYQYMFKGCTSLTEAPVLPATSLNVYCYKEMFKNCSSLSAIEVNFTAWNSTSTNDWVLGIASSGTFKKPSALSGDAGTSRIPENWTIINQ